MRALFLGCCLAYIETVLLVSFALRKNSLCDSNNFDLHPGTNNPVPGLFICSDADPPNEHWIAYAPTTMLIAETIMLCLALNKAWEHHRDGAGGRMIPWLTKESVYFFIPYVLASKLLGEVMTSASYRIFFIHFTTLALWMINKVAIPSHI